MLIKKEIVRSIYEEIKSTFTYSFTDAEEINKKARKDETKARDMPYKCYMVKKGTSLQYAMAMLYRFKQNGIKAFLGIYKGEGLYSAERKDDYAFVIYNESFFKWYVVDLEPVDPSEKIVNPVCIPIKTYKKMKGKLWFYNPYDEVLGNLPIFDGFFKEPIWKF